ncbi:MULTISPECIES: hypothetical protein [Flavobacteriaceae]|uniref:Uncharacterized protein n=3 Tax=Flavobacteriaceae TaxID=49546 RepID=A0A4Y8ATA9_9FLAO|nr:MULTISPECIES: hypothetical protein [Flavobacteriaceae]TEW75131.1 hypothetical protein E2488_06305 [Gramella jeungdoensis]GGK41318.1 hypothetical protein GCM10007963_06690 [Lutibacter litoralis]
MKNIKLIKVRIAEKRHKKKLRRRRKKSGFKHVFNRTSERNYEDAARIKHDLLSDNLRYISDNPKTKLLKHALFFRSGLSKLKVIKVPKIFSLVDNSEESYKFIEEVINCIYHNRVRKLRLDYSQCEVIHLGAQVYLDVLLKEIFVYAKTLASRFKNHSLLENVRSINVENENVDKLLYSIGSFAIHTNEGKDFDDIIPYQLCEFRKKKSSDPLFNIETKERHVTDMVQYVMDSVNRVGKQLSPDSIESLSIIIGEVLINAEEHSTNNHRFSIGYFQEHNGNKKHYGIFNLTILNFGHTIYDSFKNENCPRKDIVSKMNELSKYYTSNKLFSSSIKEETLWTLYALQEEITSVSPEKNIKRGNGSIKFIENFFNLKGSGKKSDKISRLAVLSGNASIVFDGKYGIGEKIKINEKTGEEEKFQVMTFNDSGNISDKPDKNYVKFVKNHFPGTIISAQILISKDDIV